MMLPSKRQERKAQLAARVAEVASRIQPEDPVSVSMLAVAARTTSQCVYNALYDKEDPMPCMRRGRAIRVRLVDWREWWSRKRTTIEPGSPARAPSRAKRIEATPVKPSSNRLAQRIAAALTDLELHHEDEPDEATAIPCATVARVTAMTVGKQSLTESTGVEER